MEEAVQRNDLIPEGRKGFLLDRLSQIKVRPAGRPEFSRRFIRELWDSLEGEPEMIEPEPPDW